MMNVHIKLIWHAFVIIWESRDTKDVQHPPNSYNMYYQRKSARGFKIRNLRRVVSSAT